MYLDAIFEVAIGLVITWLVLSIATMQIQEWISSISHRRAKFLEESLQNMFRSKGLVDEFYRHPMIASLHSSKYKPSYIPANRFAQTLDEVYYKKSEKDKNILLFGEPIDKPKPKLEDVKGIGWVSVKWLKKRKINTIEDLVDLTPEELRNIFKLFRYANLANEEVILQYAKKLLEEYRTSEKNRKKKSNRS